MRRSMCFVGGVIAPVLALCLAVAGCDDEWEPGVDGPAVEDYWEARDAVDNRIDDGAVDAACDALQRGDALGTVTYGSQVVQGIAGAATVSGEWTKYHQESTDRVYDSQVLGLVISFTNHKMMPYSNRTLLISGVVDYVTSSSSTRTDEGYLSSRSVTASQSGVSLDVVDPGGEHTLTDTVTFSATFWG